jgi:HlyD family secretion protein
LKIMWTRWFPRLLWTLAVLGFVTTAFYLNTKSRIETPVAVPLRPPAQKPFDNAIAGLGLVESATEHLRISPYFAGRVLAVYVKEGDTVNVGTPLYKLDTAILQEQLLTSSTQADAAKARWESLTQSPRPEDLPPLEAKVAVAKVQLAKAEDAYKRVGLLADKAAMAEEQQTQRRLAVDEAKQQLKLASADLNRLKAGAWAYDVKEAKAQWQAAQGQSGQLQTQLKQALVLSPVAATVLKVNLHVGEGVAPSEGRGEAVDKAPVLLGSTETLNVRVEIDEVLANQVRAGADAVGYVRGNSKLKIPLSFIRIQPLMLPKRNLNGNTNERNDVRVLQVLYRAETEALKFPLYPGQLLEVYIKP